MSNYRLISAEIFGVVGLLLVLMNDLGLVNYLGISAALTGIPAFILALAAFFVAIEKGAALITGTLIVQGRADTYASYLAGVTIGVYFGLFVLSLGISKLAISIVRSWDMTGASKMKAPLLSSKSGISKTAITVILVAVIAVAGFATYYSVNSQAESNQCGNTTTTSLGGSVVEVSITSGTGSRSGAPGYAPDALILVIGVNNTVAWTNNDSVAHTVTSSSTPTCGSFNSENMSPGAVYTHTFTKPGSYQYYCKYHSWMTGNITVVS